MVLTRSVTKVSHRPIQSTIKLTTLQQVEKSVAFEDKGRVYLEAMI